MSYSIVERGQSNTLNYRIFLRQANGNIISPFHDIPLYYDEKNKICNMVVEIPRWTNAKMEICKEEKLNPIKQDVKKGKLRYVKNIFPHHGYIWNYGALPQTWENPSEVYQDTKTAGDNDPIDVCEIGHKIHKRGAVIQVKILGAMLLIDEGETDWKIIAIDVTDPLADKLTDIDDIEREMPGFLKATYQWFRYYKVPDGKPENTVHWDGECQRRALALEVIDSAYKQWNELMNKPSCGKGISCTNTTVSRCPEKVTAEASQSLMDEAHPDPFCLSGSPPQKRQKKEDRSQSLVQSESVDSEVDKWYYVIPQ